MRVLAIFNARCRKRSIRSCNLRETARGVRVPHFHGEMHLDALFPMHSSRPMDRSYLAGGSLSPENKRRTYGAHERVKKGEPGGEFDSLSTPPPPLCRGTAACAVKKHGRYEFRFTLRGSSTRCPIKKLRCAALVPREHIVRSWPASSSLLSSLSSLLLSS